MTKPKYYLLLLGTALAAAFVLILGWYLIFLNHELNSTVLFLAGIGALLAGVFVLTAQLLRRVFYSAGLLTVALYFFLRAFGILAFGPLAILFGLGAWAAAAIIVYFVAIVMNPDNQPLNEQSRPP